MLVEVKVPVLAESVAEATLMSWNKKPGEKVKKGDSLIDIETDKVTLEIAAVNDGVLTEILREDGAVVVSDEVIARIETGAEVSGAEVSGAEIEPAAPAASGPAPEDEPAAGEPPRTSPAVRNMAAGKQLDLEAIPTSTIPGRVTKEDVVNYLEQRAGEKLGAPAGEQPAGKTGKTGRPTTASVTTATSIASGAAGAGPAPDTGARTPGAATPSATAPSATTPSAAASGTAASGSATPGTAASGVTASGATTPGAAASGTAASGTTAPGATTPGAATPGAAAGGSPDAAGEPGEPGAERLEQRVPMTRLRRRAAERLLGAQHDNAILSTFNEVNMEPVMTLRGRYKEEFEQQHKVKLGFMSFFTRAVVEALKKFPIINASVDGEDILYHNYFDIGIAVSAPRGLVVPIVRDADTLSLSDIEQTIRSLSSRARDNKLGIEDLTGGTFTITNGGVFGSLLSTPIINPPQSAILGMHKIQERPVAADGQIVVRPMMYLALSYDHRIIDGSEAVQFLVAIKTQLEDPARMLLQL